MAREHRPAAAGDRVVGDRKQRHQDPLLSFAPHHPHQADNAGDEQRQTKPIPQRGREVVPPASSEIRAMTLGEVARVEQVVGDELLVVDDSVGAHDEKGGDEEESEHDDSAETSTVGRRSGSSRIANKAGSATITALYLVAAARPVRRPAATRSRLDPETESFTMARKATRTMHDIGMSVTPKWESRTCRKASARKVMAMNATARSKRRAPIRNSSQTLATPAVALRKRATIRSAGIVSSGIPDRCAIARARPAAR